MFKTQKSENNGYMCLETRLRDAIDWTTQLKNIITNFVI